MTTNRLLDHSKATLAPTDRPFEQGLFPGRCHARRGLAQEGRGQAQRACWGALAIPALASGPSPDGVRGPGLTFWKGRGLILSQEINGFVTSMPDSSRNVSAATVPPCELAVPMPCLDEVGSIAEG